MACQNVKKNNKVYIKTTTAKRINHEKTFRIKKKYIVYCITSIIKTKETDMIIKLLFYKFYSAEVKKIKNIHFI